MGASSSVYDQQFERLKLIGKGGYGSVYLVQHSKLGKVVLKEGLKSTKDLTQKDLEDLKHEAEILKNLKHPNVVTFYEGRFDSTFCGFFLEYVDHGSVDGFLQQFKVDKYWKVQIILDVSMAMYYLHQQHPIIVHGYLKCQNILIGQEFHAKVCDFGLARIQCISKSKTDHDVRGTLEYIAPEYLINPKRAKTKTFDVYFYAISAWEIFYEKRAYHDYCERRTIPVFVEKGDRPKMADNDDQLPDEVKLLIQHCWDQEEEKRPTFLQISDYLNKQLSLIRYNVRRSLRTLQEQSEFHRTTIKQPSSPSMHQIQPTETKSVGSSTIKIDQQYIALSVIIKNFKIVIEGPDLRDYIDPENGLVRRLSENKIIDKSEVDTLRFILPYQERNEEILLMIEPKIDYICDKFIISLCQVEQEHIAAFIASAGCNTSSDNRLLPRNLRKVIDDNMFCLEKLMDTEKLDLIRKLVRQQCITSRHRDRVVRSKPEMKAYELLIIIQRRRYIDFMKFMECLRNTMQNNMVKILKRGGITAIGVQLFQERDDIQHIEAELIKKLTGYVDDENKSDLNEEQRHFVDDVLAELKAKDIYFIGICMETKTDMNPTIIRNVRYYSLDYWEKITSFVLVFQSETDEASRNLKYFCDSGLMASLLDKLCRGLLSKSSRFPLIKNVLIGQQSCIVHECGEIGPGRSSDTSQPPAATS